jgi:hypothetical protein
VRHLDAMGVTMTILSNLWELAKALVPAGAAYLAVYYGQRRTALLDASKLQREATYLATIVSGHLERFLVECYLASRDDGSTRGEYPPDGGIYATTKTPEFDPKSLDVNWQSLPPDVMYEVLAISDRVAAIGAYLDGFPHDPYDSEMLWHRGHEFAKLGKQVTSIAARLRQATGIPDEVLTRGHWSREEGFDATIQEFEKREAQRAEDHRRQLENNAFPVLAAIDP